MTYYEESTFLDLSKEIYSMQYHSLIDEATLRSHDDEEDQQAHEVDFSTNAYLFFKEKHIMKLDILNLCRFLELKCLSRGSPAEELSKVPFGAIHTRINQILQKYHEQPALLDKISKFIILQSMEIIKKLVHRYIEDYIKSLKAGHALAPLFDLGGCEVLKILYILIGIRGQDRVLRHFPHEPQDFEPLIFVLASQRAFKEFPWEANFVLLSWLSLILLMPFDLCILDSQLSNSLISSLNTSKDKITIVDVIIELCKHFLNSTTRITVAASTCLAKLFSRKDIKDQDYMVVFVTWALDEIDRGKDDQMQSFFITGLYEAIHRILKILNREDLKKITNLIYTRIFQQSSACFVNTIGTVRLNRTKIAMGICLVLLKKKECSWMHKRSKRNLLNNFTGNLDYTLVQTNVSLINNRINDSENSKAKEDEGIEEDVDLDALENLIGFIFDSLKDKETNVRWAAAQGIGRITSRLDLDLADDIVNEIVDTFLHAGENEWHGGLMALGELARRGLLLPSNLDRVIHILKKGLIFEVTQGTYTTGSNVRDAACYVAWAFSRAFEPEIMQSYVIDLSSSLLLCSLYDKEASCRRAAAAAFQENVGRQGNFPKGIEIITEADYFSLGVRNNSYLVVSIFVSHYQEYYRYFVEHLSQIKLFHVDIDIRKLSAATLSLLTCLDPDFMVGEILPGLIKKATSANFYERHGAILGVGEILIGLAGKGDDHNLKDCMKDSIFLKTMTANERKLINPGEYMKKFQAIYEEKKRQENIDKISPEMKKEILKIVGDLEEKRLYRGKGGDQLRVVISRFIFDIALSGLKITKSIHNQFMDTLDENLRNPLEIIMKEAESALLLFSKVYHKKVSEESQAYVAKFLKKSLVDPLINVKRGYTIAITSLSQPLLEENIDAILEVLVKNSEIQKKKSEDDPDLRNFSVKGLRRLITRVSRECLTAGRLKTIVDRLIYIMDDYSVDRRGDIGSMVRETGMYAFLDLLAKSSDEVAAGRESLLQVADVRTIVGLLLQQLVEKMDKMRLISGSILQSVVDHKPRCLDGLEEKGELVRIFGNEHLRLRVKQDQERLEHKFDVSLVDTSFLDYHDNEAFIYFWDVPQCVFPLLMPLINSAVYSAFIVRGLCLSLGGITVSTSDHSIKALYTYINAFEGDKTQLAHSILDHFFTILGKYKKIERFLTPVFSTLAFFYKIEDFIKGEMFEEKSLKIVGILYDELSTTKYASKLNAGVATFMNCITSIFGSKERSKQENKALLKESKMLELMSHLLNHEFPVVSKTTSDLLYLWLNDQGEMLLESEKSDELIGYITSRDWLQIDVYYFNPDK